MPKVVIELQANTQAAVQQIQAFAKAQKDAFDAVRAGNPALAEASVKVSKLTESTGQAVKASDSANRAFRSFASQGVAQLANEIPGVGGALGQLAQTLGTFPLLIGAAVAVGIGFAKMLQQWSEEARKADAATLKLAESIGTTTKKSLLEVQEIRARAAGDDARVLALQTEQALAEAERVKQGRIKKAREESEQGALFGLLRKQMSLEALQEIDAAEAEFAAKRKVIQANALADQQKLDKARREEAEQWFEKEAARFQALEDMAVTLARAQLAATLAGQTGAAGRTGDPAALVRAQYAERTAAIRQSYEDQLKIQDAALAKGEIVDKEYAARRQALLDVAATQQKTLADQFAADETAALAKIDAAALKLFEQLGPGFEEVTEKLRLAGIAEEARSEFQTINAAFQQGRISANDAAEAVRRVTENLLAQGLILDDIARVVPITLQNMSGLFRGMTQVIEGTTLQIGGVVQAMDQLSPQPIAILTDGWWNAVRAAEAYRIQVEAIARIGPITVPGTAVITPQSGGGLSADDRRALAEQMADDERRGLSGE